MGRELHSYTGDGYLHITDIEKRADDSVEVFLEGEFQDEEFLSNAKNAPDKLIITLRRLLIDAGVTIEMGQEKPDVSSRIITLIATLRQTVANPKYNMIPLLNAGNIIANAHHFNGSSPIDKEALEIAIDEGNIIMSNQNQDLIPRAEDEELFELRGSRGQWQYYPESEKPEEFISRRLFQSPGRTEQHSKPYWTPQEDRVYRPDELFALQVTGFRSRFFSLVVEPNDKRYKQVIASPANGATTVFDRNTKQQPVAPSSVQAFIYDLRRAPLVRPMRKEESAETILTQDFESANAFIERLSILSGKDPNKRVAAFVQNAFGIRSIQENLENDWVMMKGDCDEKQPLSPHTPRLSGVSRQSLKSPILKLLRQAKERGFDSGGMLVSETFPEHATLNILNALQANEGRKLVNSILFRHASANHGPFFSKHDYTALGELLNQEIEVYWANGDITKNGNGTRGDLLKLVRTELKAKENHQSMAFVPVSREKEYRDGFHIVGYGTARTLNARYQSWAEQFFEQLMEVDYFERQEHPDFPEIVVESGGGPDASTMGVFNMYARKYGRLSIGHPLDVKKEPSNNHMDGLMPFRGDVRDIRQANMATGHTFIGFEGGGGTREERGIAQTDLAIVRTQPFPLLLIGEEFYTHEYLQYLHEVKIGTLDPEVLNCVSIIDLDRPEDAVEIIMHYRKTGEVKTVIPEKWIEQRAAAIESFKKFKQLRQEAWNLPQ